jgi:hypothetical protein
VTDRQRPHERLPAAGGRRGAAARGEGLGASSWTASARGAQVVILNHPRWPEGGKDPLTAFRLRQPAAASAGSPSSSPSTASSS